MLGNLKKKLNSAIQEGISLSENLQQQYRQRVNSTPSTPVTPTANSNHSFGDSLASSGRSSRSSLSNLELASPDINVAAGCNLLAKYEDDWKAVHDANEENAQRAAEVAAQIEAIEQRTTTQRVVMTDLISCMAGIPMLLAKLQASMETLQELNALNATAEQQLERLEDLCEECELQEFMLQKQCEVSQYNQKKMAQLETYRQQVAATHQQKIQQQEQRLRQIQRERQAVFEDAFRGDLAEYKQRGSIPKIQKESSCEVALEEVILEDNETKDALEDFLNG